MFFAGPTITSRWYETRGFRKLGIGLLGLILTIEGVVAIFCRQNDFECHQVVGEAFLEGDVYRNGAFIMYPVGRIMMNGLLAIGPHRLTRAISYVLAVSALHGCWRIWNRLTTGTAGAAGNARSFAVVFFTFALMVGYTIRDLDECGLQIFLLFMLSVALSDLLGNRPIRAGFWLATAATFKATPILFLPYLLWKRQWRAASWMAAFIVAWGIAPVPVVGVEKTLTAQKQWLAHIQRVMEVRKAYPDQLVEAQRNDNLSLAALLARNLESYPPGHPLHVDHPMCWQLISLPPEAAYVAVRLLLLALGAALAWRFRHTVSGADGAIELATEWAALCLLTAILSPVVWKQHLVLELPAVFLLVRRLLATPSPSRRQWAALIALGMATNLSGSFLVSGDIQEVLHAYKLDTLAALGILLFVLRAPVSARNSATGSGMHDLAYPPLRQVA